MVEGWRALANECDKLSEATNTSLPSPAKKLQDET
jgi:hypothetical protein